MNSNHSIQFFLLLISTVTVSCSKGTNDKQTLDYDEQRIAVVRDQTNNQTATFTYDNQKRLSRIDYNYDDEISVRFEYGTQTITAQYYKGAAPDLQRNKYVYTLLNGKVTNTRMTKPNGVIYDTYYGYDASGKMIETGFRAIQNGNLFTALDCYYSYNGPANTQEIKIYGTRGIMATDTVKLLRTYSDTKRFFTLINIGFDYFGEFPTGIAYRISGITDVVEPFPFFTSRPTVSDVNLVPSDYALQKMTGEGITRNLGDPFNNGWQPVSWDWTDPGDSYSPYEHDEKGRLTRYDRYKITWQ